MTVTVREYEKADIKAMGEIWDEVVNSKDAFPQIEPLGDTAEEFFASQSRCAVAEAEEGNILGLYILHPNNVGRCAHIANASYAVSSKARNMHIGEKLVRDCLSSAKALGFGILQFNAVVSTNAAARHLYEKLGFIQLGTIKGGFKKDDGTFADICPYYISL